MIFYIRDIRSLPRWVTFVNSLEELKSLIDYFIPGQRLIIGDVSRFNKHMTNTLLKFVEQYPEVDCYSSQDITDRILLSRFTQVKKGDLQIQIDEGLDKFEQSDKDFLSVATYCPSVSPEKQLRLYKSSKRFTSLISAI